MSNPDSSMDKQREVTDLNHDGHEDSPEEENA